MSSVFFTDTDCELWYTDAKKYDIKIIGMPYTLDGVERFYDMGENTDFKLLNNRMREGAMPITSALNPQDYIDYFEPIFKAGQDIFYVHFSDKLSGTFNYMKTALDELKEKYPDRKITLFNTKSICYGAGIQALEAGKLHYEGKSDEEILEFLNDFTTHIATHFVVDSLTHLKRGGRIGSTSAVIGSLLNIKPIIKVTDEGKLEKYATAKGLKKALSLIVSDCVKNVRELEKYPILIVDADNKEMADYAENLVKETLGDKAKIEKYPIGPVIGAHCGPGTVGLIYYAEKR